MNELERIEAEGYAQFCELLGGTVTRLTGGVCLNTPVPVHELNRVADVTEQLDLDAVAAVYAGKAHLVSVPPWVDGLDGRLEAHGLVRRSIDPPGISRSWRSDRNILRAGFREASLRPNWRSPD